MKLFTIQGQIDTVAERWREQYPNSKQEIYERLIALSSPTRADVDAAIGNSSWLSLTCDECQEHVDALVELGEEPDWESATVHICLECLRKANELIEGNA